MVLCTVYGCLKHSGHDKDVSFYRISAVSGHQGQHDFELRKKQREGYLAAILRKNMDAFENCRVCLKHFISGKPADLYDVTSPDWLPTLNLGHDK